LTTFEEEPKKKRQQNIKQKQLPAQPLKESQKMAFKRSTPKSDASMGNEEASFHAFNSPRKLPAWLDHFNAKDLKILFKCSVAVWIFTLFILISDTLRVLGQATFFGW
jgi:hypothetical protein